MTQEELERKVMTLSAQHLIMRDFIAWLLAREVGNSSDPQSVLRLASEFGDTRIDGMTPKSAGDLQISEMLRKEKDWIIGAASKVLGNR